MALDNQGSIEASAWICPGAGNPSRAGWTRLPLTPSRAEPRNPRNPRLWQSRVAWYTSFHGCHLPGQPPDPVGEQLHAAFHSLPKADAAFSNSSAVFFSFPVFIYLLLVLKTKTVSLFNALEMGGWMGGGAVCIPSKDHMAPERCVWGHACPCVMCGELVNPLTVLCTGEWGMLVHVCACGV